MAGRVLVTGASGFVGGAVCEALAKDGWEVRSTVSRSVGGPLAIDLEPQSDWRSTFEGCAAVVHLAARAHVLNETSSDVRALYLRTNSDATLRLAEDAAASGVRRFVFLSSVKVHDEAGDDAITEARPPVPDGDYAVSKWHAELGLREIAVRTGLEVVVLRPPLVYGPHVKARFRQMVDWVARGLPLPLGAVQNRRSFIGLRNLANAVVLAATHPAAAGRTYLIADEEAVSTPDLLRAIGAALNKPARLISLPPSWLRLAGRMIGKQAEIDRLIGSLRIDSGAIQRELGWRPPYTMAEELEALAVWYRSGAN